MYDFTARSLDALLPGGARLLDLGVGSGRALARIARLRPATLLGHDPANEGKGGIWTFRLGGFSPRGKPR